MQKDEPVEDGRIFLQLVMTSIDELKEVFAAR